MPPKTPPYPEHPEWSTAKYWQFIRSALRAAWQRWPPKWQTLNNSKRTVKGKRHKYEYKCNGCKKWHKGSEVAVDHIVPAGSLNNYGDLPGFVSRLFVGTDKLQVLCKECHAVKSKEERK